MGLRLKAGGQFTCGEYVTSETCDFKFKLQFNGQRSQEREESSLD